VREALNRLWVVSYYSARRAVVSPVFFEEAPDKVVYVRGLLPQQFERCATSKLVQGTEGVTEQTGS
jgi:hypothetical protein